MTDWDGNDTWAEISPEEAAFLANETSSPEWQRRAVGVPTAEALAYAPKNTPFQTWLPLGLWTRVRQHLAEQEVTKAQWLRRAIATQYELEGGDPDVAIQIRSVQTKQHEPVE